MNTGKEELPNQDIPKDSFILYDRKESRSIPFFLWGMFFFGVLAGSFYIIGSETSMTDSLGVFLRNSIMSRIQGSGFSVFVASMASSFLFLTAVFFIGMTMWGRGAEPLFPLLRGIGIGMTAGYLYSGIEKGIGCYLLMILPGAALHAAAVINASVEGMRYSSRLNRFCKAANPIRCVPPSVPFYAARIGTFAICDLIGALIDAVSVMLFSGLFQTTAA